MPLKGFRFPKEIVLLAVRWYLRYGLSCRDLEEMLEERDVWLDHTTIFRWVHRFTPLLIAVARDQEEGGGRRVAEG